MDYSAETTKKCDLIDRLLGDDVEPATLVDFNEILEFLSSCPDSPIVMALVKTFVTDAWSDAAMKAKIISSFSFR